MLWDKHIRKRKQKAFRNIAVYDPMRQRTPIRFHFTKTRTIVKECHTTIQRHNSIHNTYPIHLYVRQVSTLQETYPTLYQTKKYQHTRYALSGQGEFLQVSSLQLHDIMRQKLYEEKRYFQSHPYQARQLALSYLQTDVIRSALHQHIQLTKRYAPSVNSASTPIYLKSALSSQQVQAELTSQLQQVAQQEAQQITNPKPVTVPSTRKVVQPQLDEEPLIRRIVKEVLRRLRQEKMREGR